jgi:Asp-tRNA(Asn)/Glu-tRNA(Gln) amidotransferase A subunit family amidase
VAWSKDLGFAVVDPEVAAIGERAAVRFASATGAVTVDRPMALGDYTRIYASIEGVDRFVGVDRTLWETRLDELDPLGAPAWTYLSRKTLPEAAAVEFARRGLVTEVAAFFDDVDLLLTPMASVAPFAAEGPMPTEINGVEVHAGMSVVLGFLASLVNLPAISVPAGLTSDGLPVGLQVTGRRFREDVVLAAAARYESAHPWPRHCPDGGVAP